jgi:NarL family two-component system response regulator LiaR
VPRRKKEKAKPPSWGEAKPSRVVIADDHPLFRSALRQMVEGHSEFEVVGEAANGRAALALCHRLHPQLVLLDLSMPQMHGIEATRAIKRELPDTIVVILTAFAEPSYLSEALKAGATGYALKEASAQEISIRYARHSRASVP